MRALCAPAAGGRVKPRRGAAALAVLVNLLLLSSGGCLPPPAEIPEVQSAPRAPEQETTQGAVRARPAALPDSYRVHPGDTLYAIAWRFGLDYLDLARFNGISPPYLIRAGEFLKLQAPRRLPSPPISRPVEEDVPNSREIATRPRVPTPPLPRRDRAAQTPSAREPEAPRGIDALPRPGHWAWPTQGRPTRPRSPVPRGGIDIAGRAGQPVWAAAPGKVVYVGDGVLGYNNLVIIKHNDELLSAYAHNREVLVREGQRVRGGEQIAAMGTPPHGKSMLHFEIRRGGRSEDPLRYLRRP